MSQQERSRRTRERVLDAAAQEFSRRGYADAAVQSVAARTGMTKGALYGHFASKEKLADALVAEGVRIWARMLQDSAPAGATPLGTLRALTVGLAHALREDARLRAAVRLENDGLLAGTGEGSLLREVHGSIVSVVRRAQDVGDVTAEHSAGTIAQLLLSVVFGAQSAAVLTSEEVFGTWLERVWDLVLAMVEDTRVRG